MAGLRYRLPSKKILIASAVLLSLLITKLIDYNRPKLYNFSQPKTETSIQSEFNKDYIGWVKRVIDGDTVVLANNEKVRYIGVNTPEMHRAKKAAEYYAREAKDFNGQLVSSKKVRLEFDEERRDKYGRILAYVYLEDGTFVNAELIRHGYARTMVIKPNTKYADLFKRLQEEARREEKGMWGKK